MLGMKQPSRQLLWERRSQTPLLVLAVGFAVAYAVPIVVPDASAQVHRACTYAEWVVWGAFAVDYVVRLGLAADRRHFVRTHWLDLCAVVLPLAQPCGCCGWCRRCCWWAGGPGWLRRSG